MNFAPAASFPGTTFAASFLVNAGVALILFMVLGGRRLMQMRSDTVEAVAVPHVEIARPATGPQIFGDSEAEALSRRIGEEGGPLPAALTEVPLRPETRPVTTHIPPAGGVLRNHMGYLVGAGGVFLIAGLAALWSALS